MRADSIVADHNQPFDLLLQKAEFLRCYFSVSSGCPLKLNIDSMLSRLLGGGKLIYIFLGERSFKYQGNFNGLQISKMSIQQLTHCLSKQCMY